MFHEAMVGKTILVIDDDADFFKLTSLIFKSSGAQAIMSTDGQEGMDKLITQRPDLIILDAMIPGMDGFQICQKIRQFSNIPLIMISAMDHDELMLRGLNAGADDFLSKPVNPEILLARAKALIRRTKKNSDHQEVLTYKDNRLEIDIENHRVLVYGKQVKLSSVEFRLLAFLMGNAGRVTSYEQILFGVWSGAPKEKLGYVHVYISHLRTKLEENPRKPNYIRSVYRVGYIFEKQS